MPSLCACGKQACFKYAGEKQRLYCAKCKSDDMVDVNNKTCIKCDVNWASFKYDGEKAK